MPRDPSHMFKYSVEAAAETQQAISNHELQQVIEAQKREITYLAEKIDRLEKEKQDMIDNFKLSSSVLLERLKDLEAQTSMIGERPQTANVLSKISKCRFY
jgi:cell division protein FtsB